MSLSVGSPSRRVTPALASVSRKALAAVRGQAHRHRRGHRSGVADDDREPRVGGVGRDRRLFAVEVLVGPVVVEARVRVVRDRLERGGVRRRGRAGTAVFVDAHDDADASVHRQPRLEHRLGREQRRQRRAAVVLHARPVDPAVLDVGRVVGARRPEVAEGVPPARQLGGRDGSRRRVQVAQRHDHLRGVRVTDLRVDVLVGLALDDHRETQVLGQLDHPGELGDLAVVLVLVGRGVADREGVRRRGRAAAGDGVVASPRPASPRPA